MKNLNLKNKSERELVLYIISRSREYREKCIRYYIEEGYTADQIAKLMSIGRTALYHYIRSVRKPNKNNNI